MSLNAIDVNLLNLAIGTLSSKQTESSSSEDNKFFSFSQENDSIKDFFEESGLELNGSESFAEILLLILSLLFGIDLNKDEEDSKTNDSAKSVPLTSKSGSSTQSTQSTQTTQDTEDTSVDGTSSENDSSLIQGEQHPYDTLATADSLQDFAEENPELFDKNTTSEEYIRIFDELAEQGEVVKQTDHKCDEDNYKQVDTIEKTVVDMGNGIYLRKEAVTELDGEVTYGRAVQIGSDYKDIQYDENGDLSKVVRGEEAKENGGHIATTTVSNCYTGDGEYATARGDDVREYLDKNIEMLEKRDS